MNTDASFLIYESQILIPFLLILVYGFFLFYFSQLIKDFLFNNKNHIESLFHETVKLVVLRNRRGFRQQRIKSWINTVLNNREFKIRFLEFGIHACLIVLGMIFLLGFVLQLS